MSHKWTRIGAGYVMKSAFHHVVITHLHHGSWRVILQNGSAMGCYAYEILKDELVGTEREAKRLAKEWLKESVEFVWVK